MAVAKGRTQRMTAAEAAAAVAEEQRQFLVFTQQTLVTHIEQGPIAVNRDDVSSVQPTADENGTTIILRGGRTLSVAEEFAVVVDMLG